MSLARKQRFSFDGVVKDLFETDRPSLLEQLTGGLRVLEFLNVEFKQVVERRADLLAFLEDGSIFHFEFQGRNDSRITYRQAFYGLLIAEKYRRPVRQVVLYVGKARMRMQAELDTGSIKASFRLVDIREIDAEELMRSGSPGDLALAILARGGAERLVEIAHQAAGLQGGARQRVLAQLAVLSGLRGLSDRMRMEIRNMGSLYYDIRDNVILYEVWKQVMAEGLAKGEAVGEAKGKAEGQAEGEMVGMVKALRGQLHTKFGHVPKWADARLKKARRSQIERWLNKVVVAESLEGVIGKK